MGFISGMGKMVDATGDLMKSSAKIVDFATDTALEVGKEAKSIIAKVWEWIKNSTKKIIEYCIEVIKATIETIKDWFKNKNVNINKQNDVMFLLTEELRDGKYNIIQGVFSKVQDNVIDHQCIYAKDIDEILAKHKNKIVLVS